MPYLSPEAKREASAAVGMQSMPYSIGVASIVTIMQRHCTSPRVTEVGGFGLPSHFRPRFSVDRFVSVDTASGTQMKRNQIFAGLLVAASSCLVAGCGEIAKLALKGTLKSTDSPAERGEPVEAIHELFEQANAMCPKRMDAYTTLESVKMIDDRRVEYKYRVNNEGKNLARQFDKDLLRKAAIKMMKGNAMAVAIAKRDLSIEHIYEDAFGGHVLSFTINRQVLQGNPYPVGSEQENPFGVQTVSAKSSDDVTADPIAASSAETELAPPTNDSATDKEPLAVEPEPEPALPEMFKPARSKENPAGIRSNPFFD